MPARRTRAVDTGKGEVQPHQAQSQCWTSTSTTGWGILGSESQTAPGKWDPSEAKLNTNILELMTIVDAIDALEFRDQTLVVWSDSQVAISVILPLGSHFPDLQRVAVDLLERMVKEKSV